MKRLIVAVCLLAMVVPVSAQLQKADPPKSLPRATPAGILPGEPPRPPFPNSCNPASLSALILELLDQPPTSVAPTPCTGPASVCQSQARVESLTQALAEEQALLDLKLRIVSLAGRCKG